MMFLYKASKSPGQELRRLTSNGKKKDSPIGVGMTAKQMKRKRPINADLLNKIEPITDNQKTL